MCPRRLRGKEGGSNFWIKPQRQSEPQLGAGTCQSQVPAPPPQKKSASCSSEGGGAEDANKQSFPFLGEVLL